MSVSKGRNVSGESTKGRQGPGTVGGSGRKISARSNEQEIKVAGNKQDVFMMSYNFLAKAKHTVCAKVNVIEVSRQFASFIDHKPEFKSQVHLVRKLPNYSLFIIPSNEDAQGKTEYSVSILESAEDNLKKRNSLTAKFVGNLFISVQFKHREHYLFFKKVLNECIRLCKERTTPTTLTYEPRDVCEYRVEVDTGLSGKVLGISGGRSITNISGAGAQFFTIEATKWRPNHVAEWLDHIYLQYVSPQNRKIKVDTFLSYLKVHKMYRDFISYFEEDFNVKSLIREIGRYKNKQRNKVNAKILPVLDNQTLRRTLSREVLDLRRNRWKFNINFSLVLKKRLKKMKKSIEQHGTHTVNDVVLDLKNTEKRYWWDVESCRDFILSLLLFKKGFEKVVSGLEELFFEKEREKFEEEAVIMGGLGEEGWEESEAPVHVDADTWEDFLEEFSQEHFGEGLELEFVSYKLHKAVEQNDLRRDREEIISEKIWEKHGELKQMKEKIGQLEPTIKGARKMVDTLKKIIKGMVERGMDENSNNVKAKMNGLKRQQDKLDEALEKRRRILIPYAKKMKQAMGRLSQRDRTSLGKLSAKIQDITPSEVDTWSDESAELDSFMNNKERKRIIRKYLQDRIIKIGKDGMKEFTVKLVTSVLKGNAPPAWQRRLLGSLDRFWSPKFCKWGFTHANVQIANLGIHWFSNHLVMISSLSVGKQYEELIAVDCNCPLLINVNTIYERITKLAEEIVRANVNYQYAVMNLKPISEPGKLNCQEFTDRMIKALDMTDFFPEVKNYQQLVKSDLMKMSRQKALNLRYLDLTTITKTKPPFKKKFGKAIAVLSQRYVKYIHWYGKRVKLDEEKMRRVGMKVEKFDPKKLKENKNRVYFNTHADVDVFYHECLQADPKFDLNYPGVCQLLKGFDRVFWLRATTKLEDWEEYIYQPWENGCLFTYSESFDEMKQQVVDVEEDEGEVEEVEGEN